MKSASDNPAQREDSAAPHPRFRATNCCVPREHAQFGSLHVDFHELRGARHQQTASGHQYLGRRRR